MNANCSSLTFFVVLVGSVSLAIGHDIERGPHQAVHKLNRSAFDDVGDTLFRSVEWGTRLPGDMHGGILAAQGRVFVSRVKRPMLVMDLSGGELSGLRWDQDSAGIHGMNFFERNGETFIVGACNDGRVAAFNLDGIKQWEIKCAGGATAAAVASDGDLYVAHGYGNNLIHHYDEQRQLIGEFGGKDKADRTKFVTCHGISIAKVDGVEQLLISDREKGRLVIYSLEGQYLRTAADHLPRPCAVAVHPSDGRIAVAGLVGSVTLLTPSFEKYCRLGVNPGGKTATNGVHPGEIDLGHTVAVHGVCWDGEAVLGSAWNQHGRISRWNPRRIELSRADDS